MRNLVLFISTGAGSGLSPIAPGTVGSLVGLALWAAIVVGLGLPLAGEAALLVAVTALGIWAAGRAEKLYGKHDDGRITVDEIAGQLVGLVLLPRTWEVAVSAFLLFRLFDIAKPPPARAAESLPGGFGVMTDDLIAGLYANLVGQILWRGLWPGGL